MFYYTKSIISADLISVWKKVHAMKRLFIYCSNLVVSYVFFCLHFFISFKYDFHIDTKRMIVKVVRDSCQKITLLLLKSKSVRVIVPQSCF